MSKIKNEAPRGEARGSLKRNTERTLFTRTPKGAVFSPRMYKLNTNNVYALILAGGSGTRFWPLSRKLSPKHLLKFFGKESLLQETIKRTIKLINPKRIFIVTSNLHKFEIENQISLFGIPKENIIFEPQAKNTAAAIGIASINITKKDKDSILVILPADHHIADCKKFIETIKNAVLAAQDNYLVTLGITPTAPATGYGYIKAGVECKAKSVKFYKVQKFIEKPDLKKAKQFIRNKKYFWNSGAFIVKAEVILDEIKFYMPKLHTALNKITKGADVDKVYEKLDSVSIDYGVLEKSKKTAVITAKGLGWSDLGTLSSLEALIVKNKDNNIIQGNSIDLESKNVTILGDTRLITTIGLNNLILVDTEDALLVCHKEKAEDVKKMVDMVEKSGGYEHFSGNTIKRPWGTYTIINKGKGYKVKSIEVLPHKRLSLQKHKFRSEHWVVVEGTAKVTCGDKTRVVYANESIFVAPGQLHRLENPKNKPLKIIEVQNGSYLEEDDIERISDDFQR